MSLPQFKLQIAGFVAFLLVEAFGPLLVFAPALTACQRMGNRVYGVLASEYTGAFHRKWIDNEVPQEEEQLLGSGDIQSLADLANSFSVIRSMSAVPFTKTAVVRIANGQPLVQARAVDQASDSEPEVVFETRSDLVGSTMRTTFGRDLITVGYAAQTLPYPAWSIIQSVTNLAESNYHSGTAEISRHSGKGITFAASYTWTRDLSDTGGATPNAFAVAGGSYLTNRFHPGLDYGNVIYDRQHRFLTTWLYDLPVGRGPTCRGTAMTEEHAAH